MFFVDDKEKEEDIQIKEEEDKQKDNKSDNDNDNEEEEEDTEEEGDEYLMNCSHFWALKTINNKAFESEMEIGYIVLRYLHIHGNSSQPAVIESIVKALRVTYPEAYFITQILPSCNYFNMRKENIAAVLNYIKTTTASPLLPVEWCFPMREILDMPQPARVFRWCCNQTKAYSNET